MYDNDDEMNLYQFNEADLKTKFNNAIDILLKISPSSQEIK